MSGGLDDLYPFLGDETGDPATALAEVRRSTREKSAEIAGLRRATWDRHAEDLVRGSWIVAEAIEEGGGVLAFGNGGSATDALDVVLDLAGSPVEGWRALPGIDLTRDAGTVTAVANDVGFENAFVRQVVAYGEPGDVAIGFSTSGESESVNLAFAAAARRGLRTIGFTGGEGGRMAEEGFLDVCVIAPSSHVPRIQEAHATAWHAMLEMVQAYLAGGKASS